MQALKNVNLLIAKALYCSVAAFLRIKACFKVCAQFLINTTIFLRKLSQII
jgi:hypothetical protein